VVVAGVSALLTDTRDADFTATGTTIGEVLILLIVNSLGTTIGEVLIFVLGFFEPSGTKLSLFFCNSFS
jgi:hypothetical protein